MGINGLSFTSISIYLTAVINLVFSSFLQQAIRFYNISNFFYPCCYSFFGGSQDSFCSLAWITLTFIRHHTHDIFSLKKPTKHIKTTFFPERVYPWVVSFSFYQLQTNYKEPDHRCRVSSRRSQAFISHFIVTLHRCKNTQHALCDKWRRLNNN